MKSGRALIGIFQKMRVKNLRGVSEVRLKKSTPSPWKRRKTTSSAIFLRYGRLKLKVEKQYDSNIIWVYFWRISVCLCFLTDFLFFHVFRPFYWTEYFWTSLLKFGGSLLFKILHFDFLCEHASTLDQRDWDVEFYRTNKSAFCRAL